MPLQLDLKDQDLLSLEDAIAYEFFMESAYQVMHGAHEKDVDILLEVARLAKASYLIANIFCEARLINLQQDNDANA